jgi:hypothetical protein
MATAVRFEAQEFQYTKPKSHIMPKVLFLTASEIFFRSFVLSGEWGRRHTVSGTVVGRSEMI